MAQRNKKGETRTTSQISYIWDLEKLVETLNGAFFSLFGSPGEVMAQVQRGQKGRRHVERFVQRVLTAGS